MSQPKPPHKKPQTAKPQTVKQKDKRPQTLAENGLDNDIGLNARIGAIKLIEGALLKRNGFEEAGNLAEFMALSEAERSFARALALFVLRRLGQLDHIIGKMTKKMPPEPVRQLLRIGMAQVFFMHVPDFAAVSTTIKLAERNNNTRPFKGLVNAILRGLIREGGLKDVSASKLVPDWLYARWKQTYGEDQAMHIALVLTQEPATDISFIDQAALEAHLEPLSAQAIGGLSARSTLRGDVRNWEGYEDGKWWIQDASAAVPVNLLGDLTGKSALDICAAPGGKTMQLLAKGAKVTALDRSKSRLKRFDENLKRMGFEAELHCADAQNFDDDRQFDAVLLDVPCSSTGTYRRHPDVLWATKPADIAKLCDVQHRMLDASARRVKLGGDLIYCVCSLEREEGETQIIAFLHRNKEFKTQVVDIKAQTQDDGDLGLGINPSSITPEGWIRLLPHQKQGGQDGFFIAHLRRIDEIRAS